MGGFYYRDPGQGKAVAHLLTLPSLRGAEGGVVVGLELDEPLRRAAVVRVGAEGALPEVMAVAAALSVPDPRERPEEEKEAAAAAHRAFAHPESDFLTLLNLWRAAPDAEGGSRNALRRFCKAYQRGVSDYRDAFLRRDASGKPVTDEKTDAAIANITVYVFTGDPQAHQKILNGVGYYDEGAALDVADVKEQLRAFKARDLVKGDADPDSLLDTRFLPTR